MGNGTPSDEYESVEMWFMRRTTDRLVRENFEMTDRLVKEDFTMRTIINTSVRKLKDHAAKLGITSASLIIEGIRLILDRKDGATPQLEEIDTTGADEYVKRKAIKTLLEAHLTTESPAQAWALAYRAAWKDALDFCIQAEQALDKKEDK